MRLKNREKALAALPVFDPAGKSAYDLCEAVAKAIEPASAQEEVNNGTV